MKRGVLGFSLLVLLIQVVSAQFFSGYMRFSITDFFNSIDSQTITLSLLFFIFFALIYYVLSRVFKDSYGQPNKAVAGTISLAVSMLIVYGIYRSGFDIGGLFYSLGIGAEILYLIGFIIFIVLAIFLIKKIKFRGFLIVLGLLLISLTIFTEIFYEKGIVFLIGFILLIIGLLLWRRSRRVVGSIGKGTWKVGRGIGKGIGRGFKAAKQSRDPRYKLMRYEKKRGILEQKRLSREALASEKAAYKEEKRMRPGAIKRVEKANYKEETRRQKELEWQNKEARKKQEKFEKAQRAAYIEDSKRGITAGKVEEKKLRKQEKEEARRQKEMRKQQEIQNRRQQVQVQIQQINAEISELQGRIPTAPVMKRGKYEDRIRALEKKAMKLGKFL